MFKDGGNYSPDHPKIPKEYEDISIEYDAINQLVQRSQMEVGDAVDDDQEEMGSITRNYNNQIRATFFGLLDTLKANGANLPEYAVFDEGGYEEGGKSISPAANVSYVNGKVQLDLISGQASHENEGEDRSYPGPEYLSQEWYHERFRRYYLPETNEEYSVRSATPSRFVPESEDFVGFDQLREIDEFHENIYGIPAENYPERIRSNLYRQSGPARAFTEMSRENLTKRAPLQPNGTRFNDFTSRQIDKILEAFDSADNDASAKAAIAEAKDKIRLLEESREKERADYLENMANTIKERMARLLMYIKKLNSNLPTELEFITEINGSILKGVYSTDQNKFNIQSESDDKAETREPTNQEFLVLPRAVMFKIVPDEIHFAR